MELENLLAQVKKLEELAPVPIDLSFLVGYVSFVLSRGNVQNLWRTLKEVVNSAQENLISRDNVFQLLAVLKYNTLRQKPQKIIQKLTEVIEYHLGELICDNNFLYTRYFELSFARGRSKDSNGMGVECSMCTVEIGLKQICLLGCSHMFHRSCFQQYSKEQITNKRFPLHCPFEECKLQLSNQQILEHLSKQLRQKYEQFSFQNYVESHQGDTSWCPTPGCTAVFSFDEVLDTYRCPSCSKHYCLSCKCQMHTNMTCEQYKTIANLSQTDKTFMMFAKGAKYKQCPSCKFWVEKSQGCDHMTCRCKYQFCYICGGKYLSCQCVGGARPPLLRPPPPPPVRTGLLNNIFGGRAEHQRIPPLLRPPQGGPNNRINLFGPRPPAINQLQFPPDFHEHQINDPFGHSSEEEEDVYRSDHSDQIHDPNRSF